MTASSKPDLSKRLACPKLYADLTKAVSFMVPDQHVGDVVHKVYAAALKKPRKAPEDDGLLLAWLKAFARKIAPRHMKQQRRLVIPRDGELPDVAPDPSEDAEKIVRLRGVETDDPDVAQAARDVEGVLHGNSLAEIARARGEKPNTVSKRVWRHAPTLAALLASGIMLALFMCVVLGTVMRPGKDDAAVPENLQGAPSAPSAPVPAPSASAEVDPFAAALERDAGMRACDHQQWRVCLDHLHKAKLLDPSIMDDPKVKAAYELAIAKIEAKR